MKPKHDAYREDLAYIHDVGHGDFARRAAPWIVERLQASKLTSGLVVDLGSGSGIVAETLVESGYDVLGIDISQAMVRLSSKRVPKATFRCESLLSAAIPPCVCVTSISECLNYLFDETNSIRTLRDLFKRVYKALEPGGLFIFDVLEPNQLPSGTSRRGWREGDDWAVLFEATEDEKTKTLTRSITSFRRAGKSYRRDHETHVVRLWGPDELMPLLRTSGFHVRSFRGYGDQRFAKNHRAYLATKPRT